MKALTTILGLLLALILHKGYCQGMEHFTVCMQYQSTSGNALPHPFCTERIILPPVSIVATLKATASFTCGAKDASPSWTIDGKSSSREDIKGRGITEISTPPDANGTSISTLTVPATAENNGSVIVCVAYNIMVLRSENVTLLVQGTKTLWLPCTLLFSLACRVYYIWDCPAYCKAEYFIACYSVHISGTWCMSRVHVGYNDGFPAVTVL